MLDKFYDLTQKGFSIGFEPYCFPSPEMRIKLYRDKQYAAYIVTGFDWKYFKDKDPIEREKMIIRVLNELEQKFYHDFGKERHILYP